MPARASRLRYLLKSASKAKEEKPAEAADASKTSACKLGEVKKNSIADNHEIDKDLDGIGSKATKGLWDMLLFLDALKEQRSGRRDHFAVYAKDYQARFMLGYCSTYIFMQTFMIPGTILMSLLAGALFGVIKGGLLVVFTATSEAERYRKVQADSPTLVSVPPREESDSFEKSEGVKAEEEEAEEVLFDN